MIKSKAWSWNWDTKVIAKWWEEPSGEVYPILARWKKLGFKKFLDLGCGIGRHSILFAGSGFEVYATDLAEEGLKKLDKWAKEMKLSVKTVKADMIFLPFKDSSFDCLLAYHAIYHQDDEGIKKVIAEIKRVLKKGGEAYITFNSKNNSSFKSKDVKRLSENTIIKTKGHEEGIPHFYANKEEIETLLKDFEIKEFSYKEEYYPNFTSTHYFVLVKK
jgi:ubiquinone/menaquinone biosynthesis C-methylase UbiE